MENKHNTHIHISTMTTLTHRKKKTYRVSDNNRCTSIKIIQIIRNLHARISTANNKNLFSLILRTTLVILGVNYLSFKAIQSNELRNMLFTILAFTFDFKGRSEIFIMDMFLMSIAVSKVRTLFYVNFPIGVYTYVFFRSEN